MNNSKKISVNYSSLVGLKAELLRKKAEIDDAKLNSNTTKTTTLKTKVKNKKTIINNEKKDQNNAIEIEDINTLKKSKYMLEAKSRLYEKLKKHGDKDQMYLVDFSNKSDSQDDINNDDNDDDNNINDDYDDVNSDPEEDWIDYTDYFGRTRKCLRRDLPKMKEKDNLVKKEVVNEPNKDDELNKKDEEQPVFNPPPNEPDIELMRKKWEEQTEKLSHKTDIHYQDILFDEARTHGVGYYAFSQDEEERKKQQENLLKLRKETEQKQKEMLETKQLKDKIEKNRLRAARIRQRIRAGLSAEPEEDEQQEEPQKHLEDEKILENTIPIVDDTKKSVKQNEENSLNAIEDKIKAFGELLGKRPKFRELSQEEWIHKRRKDRLSEFAPVYDNFKSGGHLKATKDNQIIESDNTTDPIRINTGGPEPTDMWECENQQQSDDEKYTNKINSNFIGPVPSSSTVSSSDTQNPVLIPPIEILRSVPPPSLNSTITNPTSTQLFCSQNSVTANDDSDSDDSDIIGPMPPSVFDIPLPAVPQPPPPPPPTPSSSSDVNNQLLNDDTISAGLKFLRQKFDNKDD